MDSPHPRGWTLQPARAPAAAAGFPAPAGMDPVRAGGQGRTHRIPRTRGDGPGPGAGVPAPARGFPAPAGMDPPAAPRRACIRRIPRTRGDGPGFGDSAFGRPRDSPHPRGWTPVGHDALPVVGGFPAPAGMDPVC